MAKIKLITVTGLTAGDGSYVASGATVKFQTNMMINGDVFIYPRLYRSDEAFESGYTSINMKEEDFPYEVLLIVLDNDGLYNFSISQLYTKAKNTLNTVMGGDYLDVVTIT